MKTTTLVLAAIYLQIFVIQTVVGNTHRHLGWGLWFGLFFLPMVLPGIWNMLRPDPPKPPVHIPLADRFEWER